MTLNLVTWVAGSTLLGATPPAVERSAAVSGTPAAVTRISVPAGRVLTQAGVAAGTGEVVKDGDGAWRIANADLSNNPGASLDIAAGSVRVEGGAAIGAGGVYAGAIEDDGALQYGSTAEQILSGDITGTGYLSKGSSGTLVLSGTNAYSGGTAVINGRLVAASASALGTGDVVVLGTGVLQVGEGATQAVTLGHGASLSLMPGAVLKLDSLSSQISMDGALSFGEDVKVDISGLGLVSGDYTLVSGADQIQLADWDASTGLIGAEAGSTYTISLRGGDLVLSAVPEPPAYGLMGAGAFAAVAFVRRRRRML